MFDKIPDDIKDINKLKNEAIQLYKKYYPDHIKILDNFYEDEKKIYIIEFNILDKKKKVFSDCMIELLYFNDLTKEQDNQPYKNILNFIKRIKKNLGYIEYIEGNKTIIKQYNLKGNILISK